MQLGRHYSDVSVTFENISFNKELYLSKDEIIRLTIAIQIGNNEFEVCILYVFICKAITSVVLKYNAVKYCFRYIKMKYQL